MALGLAGRAPSLASRPLAPHASMPLAGTTPRAARGPSAHSPITPIVGLAAGGVLRPGLGCLAVLLGRRSATDVAVPVAVPALGGAAAPLAHDPLRLPQDRALRSADRLVPVLPGGRHSHVLADGTFRWLLTLHGALRAGALLWPLTMPLTFRLWANCLAPHAVVAAVHGALRILTTSGTLGRVAIESLGTVADVLLGAKHSAVRLSALDLAPLVRCRTQLGAARLALRHTTNRLAILLADWLRTLPGAVGHATLSLVQRHDGSRQHRLLRFLLAALVAAGRGLGR
mmetsp:Transcript_25139/g.64299  ORF Transcript_25139/g.64299 Transcript_25139/m.64299 type:complete len:286 (+) Transcript_25139:498-1355(+)